MFIDTIKWKMTQYGDLARFGINHNTFHELFSKSYRKSVYETWKTLPFVAAEALGCRFSKRTPSMALRELFLENMYDVEGFVPSPGETVIDVGANYGDSAIWWSVVKKSKVIAFEPLKEVYDVLKENVELNNANVDLHNVALGDGNTVSGFCDGNMFISGQTNNQIAFESMALDDFNLQRADILKIDVEGFEMSVLNGAKKTIEIHRPKIIIETHSVELREKCDEFLKKLNYKITTFGRITHSNSNGMDEVQNLFYTPC